MSYRPSVLVPPLIQRGTITIVVAGGTPQSGTATITAVDPAFSAVRWCGQQGLDGFNHISEFLTLVLTNATTVTASIFAGVTGNRTVQFEVISWHPSVIRSVQPYAMFMGDGGALTATTSISAVDLTKAAIFHGGSAASTSVTNGSNIHCVQTTVTLTSATAVTATRAAAAGCGCIVNGTVVEFK